MRLLGKRPLGLGQPQGEGAMRASPPGGSRGSSRRGISSGLGLAAALLIAWGSLLTVYSRAHGYSLAPPASQGLMAAPADVEGGKQVYRKRCSPCHGVDGDGNGPVAPFLNPRPRDLTRGLFKLRSTGTGEAPVDSDLIQTVRKGIPGTAMPTWEGALSQEEIQNVVAYIKTFAPERFAPQSSPEVVEIGKPPRITPLLIARGKEVYDAAECWRCHGATGRADGESAPKLEDDWGFPIRARNLTKGWQYKRGTTIEEIYARFSTGMDGTPMPSFLFDLTEEERWALAVYVTTLIRKEPEPSQVVLRSRLVKGELPTDPEDPRWQGTPSLDVLLSGQVLARPRWQNPSADLITVRSLYNGQEAAFLLEWDDPFKDTVHRVGRDDDRGLERTYANWEIYGARPHTYRDAVALQLPKRIPQGPVKPHFLWGKASEPVGLWMWKADRQEEAGEAGAVEEMIARGHLVKNNPGGEKEENSLTRRMDELLTSKPPESKSVTGAGVWKDGTWRVVMRRALDTGDDQDTLLEPGKLIPIAFQVWDGSNGERGLMMSLSSWHFLLLERPTPIKVYFYTVIGILLAGGLEVWVVWRLRRYP